MSKAVLISVKPKWCELIANGKKTVEVRKTKPKLKTPFKVYIYCTKGESLMKTFGNSCFIDKDYVEGENLYGLYEVVNGKVIGEFVCDTFITDRTFGHDALLKAAACMSEAEAAAYCVNNEMYGWHISDLVIYDKPKLLRWFQKPCICKSEYEGEEYQDCLNCDLAGDSDYGVVACNRPITRPPQSWCYVEEDRHDGS